MTSPLTSADVSDALTSGASIRDLIRAAEIPSDPADYGLELLDGTLCAIDAAQNRREQVDILARVRGDDAAFGAIVEAARTQARKVFAILDRIGAIHGLAAPAKGLRADVSARVSEITAAEKRGELRAYASGERAPLSDLLHHDVPDLAIPDGWSLQGDGVHMERVTEGGTEYRRVTYEPMLITGVLVSLDDATERVCLEWRRGDGRWRRQIVPRSKIRDARSIVKLSDDGCDVSSGNARHVVAWLAALEGANGRDLPRARCTTHLGWQGEGGRYGFLVGAPVVGDGDPPATWGEQSVTLEAEGGLSQIADEFHASGTLESWTAAVGPAMQHQGVALGVYASLCAPFLGVIPAAPSFTIDWSGTTSRGKTTVLLVAASCWGSPRLIAKWNARPTAIERRAGLCCDVPILLDDTRQAISPQIVEDTVYQIADESGRERGSIDGLRRTVRWRTVLLSTGEAPVTSFGQGGGARARALCLRRPPFGEVEDARLVEDLKDGCGLEYGHAGPAVGAWLESHRSEWGRIIAAFGESRAEYSKGRRSVGARMAAVLALLDAGAFAAHEIIGLQRPATNPMDAAVEALGDAEADSDRPAAALCSVVEWAIAHPADLWGRHVIDPRDGDARIPSRGWAGAWPQGSGWEYLAFLPAALNRVLAHQGYQNPEEILPAWKERGWLQVRGKGRTWPTPVDRSSRPECVRITRAAIESVYGDGAG